MGGGTYGLVFVVLRPVVLRRAVGFLARRGVVRSGGSGVDERVVGGGHVR